MTTMKKAIITTMAALAAALAVAAPANASPGLTDTEIEYVKSLKRKGLTNVDAGPALSVGYEACDALRAGFDHPTVAKALAGDGPNPFNYLSAMAVVSSASVYLCNDTLPGLPYPSA